jgi:ferrous iron transport protein B
MDIQVSQKEEKITAINMEYEKLHLEQSYLRQIGHFIEPALMPLGMDWKMGISILTGVAAKEIVVSTLGVIYQTDEENTGSLITKLREESQNSGESKALYNLRALSFLIFILIYFPCVGVVAAVKKETGGWKWPIFLVVYTTGLAWLMSFGVFQLGKLLIEVL